MSHAKEGCWNTTITEEVVLHDGRRYYQYSCPRCGWRGRLHEKPIQEGELIE